MAENNGKTKRWRLRGLILLYFGRIDDFAEMADISKVNVSQVLNVRFSPNPREQKIYEDTFCEPWETLGVAESLVEYQKRMAAEYDKRYIGKEVSHER